MNENVKALGLAAFIGGAGVTHFVRPEFYDAIVPRWMPGSPRTTTYVSGAVELAGAGLVANPRTRRLGALWCLATFAAVYPANLQGAFDGGYEGMEGPGGSAAAAWVRLPLQIPMFMWAISVARDAKRQD